MSFAFAISALVVAACSATSGGGKSGSGGNVGSGGSAAAGAGGGISTGGTGAVAGGATGGSGGFLVDSGPDATDAATDGPGIVNDATIDVPTTCIDGGGGYVPGPYARKCAPATDNECNGASDIESALPNGQYGNGVDDDCDGRVDEGCLCNPGTAAGETKTCWLVSGTQVDSSGSAVGWCASNSKGTEACSTVGTGEFAKQIWDGECRGAQPPFASDVCANGDFDCDGTVGNSKTDDCACQNADVECPTAPLVTAPYPDPANLPLIDGATWIKSGDPTLAKNWKWTATGGDCDNILPHPSFQIFNYQNAAGQALGGKQQGGLGPNGNQTGLVAGPSAAVNNTIYPAFALSGDYLVTGEFDLSGKHYSCTVKVQVRAPGIRAELCWTPMPNDVDLHFARLQGATGCGGAHGWFETCKTGTAGDDCYYNSSVGCVGPGAPGWGYATTAALTACKGWGSRRTGVNEKCVNPRLDLDNVTCAPNVLDPNNAGLFGSGSLGFCGAENINLDNPNNGDRFAIAAQAYGTTGSVHPHVNVYCNGERRLSLGYDPLNNQNFPVLIDAGADFGGDMWVAATVKATVSGGKLTDCTIEPVHSATFKANKDGSPDYCVDTNPENGPAAAADDQHWNFIASGQYPTTSPSLCYH